MIRKISLIFLPLLSLLTLAFSPLFGQERFPLALDFSLSQLLGKFEKNIKENPLGGGLSLSYRFPQSPWILGLSLNLVYCKKEKRVDLLSPVKEDRLPLVSRYSS